MHAFTVCNNTYIANSNSKNSKQVEMHYKVPTLSKIRLPRTPRAKIKNNRKSFKMSMNYNGKYSRWVLAKICNSNNNNHNNNNHHHNNNNSNKSNNNNNNNNNNSSSNRILSSSKTLHSKDRYRDHRSRSSRYNNKFNSIKFNHTGNNLYSRQVHRNR